ncbi:hypothetical protein PVK06_005604 [Gossypium arboreum]|uniref:Uncharacterized protein n=1 Tax=Gossypium arboreum TaxID=29729 RepID=A0ABR0QV12_GOSAR|nr:hypothetical protein PVK06_005604 [Gossypium arboreum]
MDKKERIRVRKRVSKGTVEERERIKVREGMVGKRGRGERIRVGGRMVGKREKDRRRVVIRG